VRTTKPEDVPWLFRVLWVTLPLTMGPALSQAVAETSQPVEVVVAVACWMVWFVVLLASFVPTAVSLTTIRLLAPLGLGVAIVAAVHQPAPGPVARAGALAVAAFSTGAALSGEMGLRFVQGSAYGDERRFPLRPPLPLLLIVLPLLWLVTATMLGVGALALAAESWAVGAVCSLVGVAAAVLFAKRCHRLTRRFAVFVPAGFVLHDHLVFADTAMFRRSEVRGFSIAPFDQATVSGPDAPADLTGRAVGTGIAVAFADAVTVVLAGTLRNRATSAIHVRSGRIVPTRPGAFLLEAKRRGYVATPPATTRPSVAS
jgi:hypothetical protein